MSQILGAVWHDGRIALSAASDGQRHTIALEGPLDWQVGRRTCTGYYDDTWHPCPDQAAMSDDWQCLACFRGRGDPARRDDMPACIFEPICHGAPERCVCSFGGAKTPVPHVVYCAFYGPLPKVGMTMERRVEQRLREQGADAYFIIARTPDRQAARSLEKQVAMLYGLPEWRRHQEVLPQWTRPVDWDRVELAATRLAKDLAARYPVDETLERIDHRLPPLPGRPQRISADGHHRGTWLGGRGSHLFYTGMPGPLATGTPVRAIKRNDLIGRWIDAS